MKNSAPRIHFLLSTQNRQMFMMGRLLNKSVKRQSDYEHSYDEADYLKALKKFQVESRGMLKDSQEYTRIRNKIYAELRVQKSQIEAEARKAAGGQTAHANTVKMESGSYYNMLIVSPEGLESFETVAVLNYFNFPMNVEEDGLKGHIRKEMGFKKDDPYPLLLMDSSSPEMPSADLQCKDNILTFLFNKKLIGTYKTYSVYEKQGLEFVEERLVPAIEALFLEPKPIAYLYLVNKHFKTSKTEKNPFTTINLWL